MSDVEWFYVDGSGAQTGPVSISDMKSAWSSGGLTDASLVWNGNMSGWQTVDATPELKKQLQPAAAAQSAVPAPAPRPQINMGGGGLGASIAAAAAGLKKGQSLTLIAAALESGAMQ